MNVSSDAAVNAYPAWGAYSASKAALGHMTRIWDTELAAEGIRFLSIDPGDMDTPMHTLAVPDANPAELKRPETAARDLLDAIAAALPVPVQRAAKAAPDENVNNGGARVQSRGRLVCSDIESEVI